MDKIYRIRPCNDYTIDELASEYLWFSRPIFFNDSNDANIGAFITDTAAIKRGILSICPRFQFDEFYDKMSYIGICCFTNVLPESNGLGKYPQCKSGNAICIEYNKLELERFFNNHKRFPLHPCFNPVLYSKEPTKLECDGEWHILWEETEVGKVYKSIPGLIHEHPRKIDLFVLRLLTRISSRFRFQHEERIILAGRNIPPHTKEIKGYKIEVSTSYINKIRVIRYSA
jgi:hypothetical protein